MVLSLTATRGRGPRRAQAGIQVVDTPGLNDCAALTELVRSTVGAMNAYLVVIQPRGAGVTEHLADTLRLLDASGASHECVFVVVTHWDDIEDEEDQNVIKRDIINRVRAVLSGWDRAHLICLSGHFALLASLTEVKTSGDPAVRTSGICLPAQQQLDAQLVRLINKAFKEQMKEHLHRLLATWSGLSRAWATLRELTDVSTTADRQVAAFRAELEARSTEMQESIAGVRAKLRKEFEEYVRGEKIEAVVWRKVRERVPDALPQQDSRSGVVYSRERLLEVAEASYRGALIDWMKGKSAVYAAEIRRCVVQLCTGARMRSAWEA
jgi:hypothetical protein